MANSAEGCHLTSPSSCPTSPDGARLREQATEQTIWKIEGTLRKIEDEHATLVAFLSSGRTDGSDMGFTVRSVNDVGVSTFGEGLANLRKLVPSMAMLSAGKGSNLGEDNWPIAAQLFQLLTQLGRSKELYMQVAAAYFEQIGAFENSQLVLTSLDGWNKNWREDLGPFFVKPDICHVAITQWIYRFDEPLFRSIATVYLHLYLKDPKAEPPAFWPQRRLEQ